jgi:hypothetical protein
MTEARGQKDNKKLMIDQQETTKNRACLRKLLHVFQIIG